MIAKPIEQQRKGATRGMLRRQIFRAISGTLLVASTVLSGSWLALGQEQPAQEQPNQHQPPPNVPRATPLPQKQGQAKPPQAPSTPPADDHKYDAYNAEKDIEVGTFYIHKGDVDAAIPRFEDAAKLRPKYGKPRLLLGEAYEKKHDYTTAVKYYKEYLKVYPNAPDAKKVQTKIEKLEAR